MHELGHALRSGWAEEKSAPLLPHVAECYSGEDCIGAFGVVGGGEDETLEWVLLPGTSQSVRRWSIMGRTDRPDPINMNRFVYSIEELSTVDFKDIPTANG